MLWRAKDVFGVDTSRIAFHVDSQSNGAHVADVSAKASDPLANARLIAAAPALRDACKAALQGYAQPFDHPDRRALPALLRAALAAAEGREP